ncbi:unnamed protein product, partial [Meganyctiphanes norvegica]
TVCSENEWMCRNGDCIPVGWRCDSGSPDCTDNSDEENCSCREGQWQCKSGQCIRAEYRCDVDEDCEDGTDEMQCDMNTTTQPYFVEITTQSNEDLESIYNSTYGHGDLESIYNSTYGSGDLESIYNSTYGSGDLESIYISTYEHGGMLFLFLFRMC